MWACVEQKTSSGIIIGCKRSQPSPSLCMFLQRAEGCMSMSTQLTIRKAIIMLLAIWHMYAGKGRWCRDV